MDFCVCVWVARFLFRLPRYESIAAYWESRENKVDVIKTTDRHEKKTNTIHTHPDADVVANRSILDWYACDTLFSPKL
jgi:hypothetical protein